MVINEHWASNLEVGDRVSATIRHETDGLLNKFNEPVIVVSVHNDYIIGCVQNELVEIPFNEIDEPKLKGYKRNK